MLAAARGKGFRGVSPREVAGAEWRDGEFAELSATSYARSISAVILPIGRGRELQVFGRFLDSLRGGPAACAFEGEAGIGKTALWREGVARARAASYLVLCCAPAEVEAALSYSSLADLLEGVEPDVFAALPAPQRDALEVALLRAGRADAVAAQRAVAMAAVSVLGRLASSTPVVVAVDDVQWLDRSSARVLE